MTANQLYNLLDDLYLAGIKAGGAEVHENWPKMHVQGYIASDIMKEIMAAFNKRPTPKPQQVSDIKRRLFDL